MIASDGDRRPAVTIQNPGSKRARALLVAYMEEVVSRYYGRPATSVEIDLALADSPWDDLAEPQGALLVARLPERDLGCVGLRLLNGDIGEVTSLFVVREARRQGVGALLLDKLEAIAADHSVSSLRLDTRNDLVEARRLYARRGFREVQAFNDEPYAERWFVKPVKQAPREPDL